MLRETGRTLSMAIVNLTYYSGVLYNLFLQMKTAIKLSAQFASLAIMTVLFLAATACLAFNLRELRTEPSCPPR